jgi:acylphosphatase
MRPEKKKIETKGTESPRARPPSTESKRAHLIISGYVQGVWFRASARDEANRLGVVGWVRNRIDGSVEVLAEGDRSQLESFVHWCHRGPEGAEVERVDVEWEPATGEFRTFQITY